MRKLVVSILLSTLFVWPLLAQIEVKGYVFEDNNQNGRKERREKGIPNVAVSNGVEVTLTDAKGAYQLPLKEGQTVFVIKPAGYKLPVDQYNIPQFYYHYKPSGSPQLKFQGVAPTGKLPQKVNFPLYKYDEPEQYTAIVFGDPQPYNSTDMKYFAQKVVANVKLEPHMLFGISLGDIVGDDLALHEDYKEVMKSLNRPWFNVMGNHDMNYDATTDELSDETFERNFGTANYAFNYGKVHYIVLDNILYPDPRDGAGYWAGYRDDQLEFLKNDLQYVPKDHLIVLSQHIHMEGPGTNYRAEDRQKLFDLLQPFENVLVMSAHTHVQQQFFYTEADGWMGKKPLHEYNAGTTSGDWYSGRVGQNGLPDATMRDGTPQGYALLNIDGTNYDIDYRVSGREPEYQMIIHAPKVVPYKGRTSARIFANVFMGRKGDLVEYSIDGGEWKPMRYVEAICPTYLNKVMEWDYTEELWDGRRPSNPIPVRHLWQGGIRLDLDPGEHTIRVRAKDMYGKVHYGERTYKILDK